MDTTTTVEHDTRDGAAPLPATRARGAHVSPESPTGEQEWAERHAQRFPDGCGMCPAQVGRHVKTGAA